MYLMFENDSVVKSNVCSAKDKKDADNYYVILLNISDRLNPMQYFQGGWHPVEGVGRK